MLNRMGFDVISLDSNPSCKANLCVDVFEWDYQILGVGYFDVITASPPCVEYSAAKTTSVRNLEEADRIIRKTL